MNIGYDIPAGSSGLVIIPQMKRYKIKENIIIHNQQKHPITYDSSPETKEIIGLCNTLDYNIFSIITQWLRAPNPKYYIGPGKVSEIAEIISTETEDNLEFVVFDCILKPNQIFNLENKLSVRVLDRNALILMIFLHHAQTTEAKLQVEYAILKHQIPYVTELVRRSKRGEHPGLMAGGEYKVDEYYRLTKTRIRKIRNDLVKIKTSRNQQRKNRRRKGFILVAIAGYTNAGKSALLKVLTDARVQVDDKMFSTVSPKTRRFRNSKVLFTDTVGFIQNIPTQLIEAFKSTLEEITDTDHIMLVVDISEELELVKLKIIECMEIINQLIIERSEIQNNLKVASSSYSIGTPKKEPKGQPGEGVMSKRPKFHFVFNKLDIVKNEQNSELKMKQVLNDLEEELAIYGHELNSKFLVSCKTKEGINNIIGKIQMLEE